MFRIIISLLASLSKKKTCKGNYVNLWMMADIDPTSFCNRTPPPYLYCTPVTSLSSNLHSNRVITTPLIILLLGIILSNIDIQSTLQVVSIPLSYLISNVIWRGPRSAFAYPMWNVIGPSWTPCGYKAITWYRAGPEAANQKQWKWGVAYSQGPHGRAEKSSSLTSVHWFSSLVP